MIKFFSVDYLDIISRYNLHIILDAPSEPEPLDDSSDEYSSSDEEEDIRPRRPKGNANLWTERVQDTSMFGYDQIISLSEESINTVLEKRRQVACYWSHEKLANFNITALSMRLLTDGKVVVFAEVDGSLAIKK